MRCHEPINPIRPMKATKRLLSMVLALSTVAFADACRRSAPLPEPAPEPAVDTAALRMAREDSIRRANEAAEAARRRAMQDSLDRARAAEEAARR